MSTTPPKTRAKSAPNSQKLRVMTPAEIAAFVGGNNVKVRVSYASLLAARAQQAKIQAAEELA